MTKIVESPSKEGKKQAGNGKNRTAENFLNYSARNTADGNNPDVEFWQPPVQTLMLDDIRSSTFNPRKAFDEDSLGELAGSLKTHGLLQPIVVRAVEPPFLAEIRLSVGKDVPGFYDVYNSATGETFEQVQGVEAADARAQEWKRCHYEIVAGERRYRAAKRAGWKTIPATVRALCSNEEALTLAITENLKRVDVSPIEAARGYKALMDMGHTQTAIGEKVNAGQAAISNAVRLLRLPLPVLNLVDSGQLNAAHGLAILRFDGFPDVMNAIGELAAERQTPSRTLEKGVPFGQELEQAGLIHKIPDPGSYAVAFDTSVCNQCPFGAMRKGEYVRACLKPEHYRQLSEEAKVQKQAAARASIEEARQRSQDALEEAKKAETALDEMAPKAEKERVEKTREQAEKVAEKIGNADASGVMDLTKLHYDDYEKLRAHNTPAGCTEACPCRVQGLHYGDLTAACLNPARLKSLTMSEMRVQQSGRKEKAQALLSEATALTGHRAAVRGLSLVVWEALNGTKAEARKAAVAALPPSPWKDALVVLEGSKATPYETNYKTRRLSVWNALSTVPMDELLRLAGEILVRQDILTALDAKSDDLAVAEWFTRRGELTPETALLLVEPHAASFAAPGPVKPLLPLSDNAPTESRDEPVEEAAMIRCARCGFDNVDADPCAECRRELEGAVI